MSGRMDFEFGFTKPESHRQAAGSDEGPARILILGNFGGHGSGGRTNGAISERTLHALDIDTFDALLTRLKPRIHLEAVGEGGVGLDIEIGELDDFHPDALYRKLDIFCSLREMRQRLLDPATFAQAAAELNPSQTHVAPESPPGAGDDEGRDATIPTDQPAPPEGDAATLERLLGRKASGRVDLTALIRDLVAPHIVPEADPRQEVYVDSLDAAIRDQMRDLLHHPSFQALESAWRSLS